MFVKLHLDTSYFPIRSSTKTSVTPNIDVSFYLPEKVEPISKHREQISLQGPNGAGANKFGRVQRESFDKGNGGVSELGSNKQRFKKDPNGEKSKNVKDRPRISNKRVIGVKCEGVNRYGFVELKHTKCSTKWRSYGGCIPSILQALDTIRDLDEALRPWAERLSNKERSIILKEQSNWERALEIFKWFKQKGCHELNVIHYNIMLRTLGKVRKWKYVESLWDEMNVEGILPINSTYGTLIDAYSKGGEKDEAVCWLERMNERGMEPDEVTMGIVVQMYKKAGEFRKAEEYFKRWSSGESLRLKGGSVAGNTRVESEGRVCLSSYTYNTLIDTYGKAGQLKEASETFALMLSEGIFPTTVTFNTMIHICGNCGQLEEVASLMKKMEELQCPTDTRTYNILISLHAKHDDINMATCYFKKMKEDRLEPDIVSYRTLLYAYSIRHMVVEAEDLIQDMDERGLEIDEYTQSALTRMYIESGMLEKSWLWFRRFHLAGNMSAECYSANIDAYGKRGHILKAERAFVCCQEGKKLTVLEFNVMIKAYGIGKSYDKACQLLDSMESHGVVPDKCSYSSIIQMLASADLPHMAKPYLRKMKEAGLINDCIPYCAVISSFVKLGQLEMAEGLYKEMIGNDVQPDVIVYGVLINAFGDSGSVTKAISYVDAMKSAGLPGNTVIYNSLIKLYTKIGYLREAQETYKMLQLSNVSPDVYSSNCMIDLYSEHCMVKQAERIFKGMKRKGNANEFTYAMMLCMYKRLGRFAEAAQIAREMREVGLLTDLLSYNNVLGLYAMDGRFKEAVETFKEMVKAAICPDDNTFKSLALVLVKSGISKQAVDKLETAVKKDPHSGLQAWISALSYVVNICDDNDDI
ncbi:PPR domain-containing protein/PPR_2 domain-containing protein [Cephalotus follicularis]|uniref:PPR domain-containing protein/PPR_2 domain-containing protein n=1 Tax=Cephalotus follicularis TaxID=3775 RepID=A0A1Q3BNF8_CEPFO|nr:PPR domain-containing protein/PPR_2 domain-containing protein [Cephalotus follicularis]